MNSASCCLFSVDHGVATTLEATLSFSEMAVLVLDFSDDLTDDDELGDVSECYWAGTNFEPIKPAASAAVTIAV